MPRRKKESALKPSYFITDPYMEIGGFPIHAGDTIKVNGEHGGKFKFIGVTTNTLTGSSWVDCFEILNGVSSVYRSFKQDRIRRIPVKRKRAKRVI